MTRYIEDNIYILSSSKQLNVYHVVRFGLCGVARKVLSTTAVEWL